MDVSEATKIVMSRIRNLDLENASRIMGYILIQDRGEKDMVMLARGPDALLLSYVNQAKAYLALNSSNSNSNSNSNLNSHPGAHIFPQSSPRILIPRNVFHYSNPASPAFDSRPSQFYGGDELWSGGVEEADAVPPPYPHRRCYSVNDAVFLEEGGGFENRPCSYYARGFCKNGDACKFLHVDNGGDEVDGFFRVKAVQPQRFSPRSHRPSSSYSKSINFLNENQRRGPRNERAQTGLDAAISSRSRQIYLTFPHESAFREEDVSNYFSKFGLVQDVRIPHQEKRMFGFVTFAYPETVKRILAKGNPHHICDCRVLVKPYKDKGKFADKKELQRHYQNLERVGVFDPPMGSGMFLAQEMVLRRNLEDIIEHQGRRMMDLQLMDNRFQPRLPVFSPRGSELLKGENDIVSCDADNGDVFQEFDSDDESNLEHILPDNLFSSPTNSASRDQSVFYNAQMEDDNTLFGTVSPR